MNSSFHIVSNLTLSKLDNNAYTQSRPLLCTCLRLFCLLSDVLPMEGFSSVHSVSSDNGYTEDKHTFLNANLDPSLKGVMTSSVYYPNSSGSSLSLLFQTNAVVVVVAMYMCTFTRGELQSSLRAAVSHGTIGQWKWPTIYSHVVLPPAAPAPVKSEIINRHFEIADSKLMKIPSLNSSMKQVESINFLNWPTILGREKKQCYVNIRNPTEALHVSTHCRIIFLIRRWDIFRILDYGGVHAGELSALAAMPSITPNILQSPLMIRQRIVIIFGGGDAMFVRSFGEEERTLGDPTGYWAHLRFCLDDRQCWIIWSGDGAIPETKTAFLSFPPLSLHPPIVSLKT